MCHGVITSRRTHILEKPRLRECCECDERDLRKLRELGRRLICERCLMSSGSGNQAGLTFRQASKIIEDMAGDL